MKLFEQIKSWFWNPVFYQNLDGRPLWPAFKRLFAFIFIASFVFTLWVILTATPIIFDLGNRFERYVYMEYPEDLILTIENGKAKTEVSRRYEISIFDFFKYFEDQIPEKAPVSELKPPVENLIVIDTTGGLTDIEDWQGASSALLVNEDFLIRFDGQKYETDSFANWKSKFILDRNQAIVLTSQLIQFLKVVVPFLGLILLLVFFVLNSLSYTIASLIAGLVISLSSKVGGGVKKDFRSGLEIALYAMCLPAFVLIVFPFLPLSHGLVSILIVLVIWLFNARAETHTEIIKVDQNHDELLPTEVKNLEKKGEDGEGGKIEPENKNKGLGGGK